MKTFFLARLSAFPIAVLFAVSLGAQPASQPAFDKIVAEYYKIHNALASDATEGVSQAAQNIAKWASDAGQKSKAKNPDFVTIKQAATSLQAAKGLKQAREQFFQLSKPIIAELKRNPAAGSHTYTCSMANKSWAQAQKEIRNPYYGKSMLKCGEPL